jgi:hypothetical protein
MPDLREFLRSEHRQMDLALTLAAAELGFRCCEQGMNLQTTLAKLIEAFKKETVQQ